MEIQGNTFKVIIRPNSGSNEIVGYDPEKKAYVVRIKAKPKDNKANKELIRFLSKVLGKRARIKSGLKSREKIINI